jgi:hypothetical protein
VFTLLGFASIFLTLVFKITGLEPTVLVTGATNLAPAASRVSRSLNT